MSMDIVINLVDVLPEDIHFELLEASIREGFSPIQWLIDHWQEGKNGFSLPGEAFYEARINGHLVGVCGINRDPYADGRSRAGRIRRLYVLPEYRWKGVGRKLVLNAVEDAHSHFAEANLRTFDQDSAKFFESIGFTGIEGDPNRTHRIAIE